MTTYAEMTEKATAQLLEAAKPIEEFAKSVAATTVDAVSKLPSLPLPKGLPTPLDVVTAQFTLAEKFLAAQKDFALSLASALPAKTTTKA